MIVVSKKVFDSLAPMVEGHHTDSSSNSQSHELMEPHKIYHANVDISEVPKFFYGFDDGNGFYELPENDIELLNLCWEPSGWRRAGKSDQTEIYHVKVEAKSCSVKECRELLNGIGRFIACSVESANLFFAALNKDGAARLKGSNGIHDVFRRRDLIFQD